MFLQKLKQEIQNWKSENYIGIRPETENILNYIKNINYLHKPQLEAFETYIYLKEIKENKSLKEFLKSSYATKKELLVDGLGMSKEEALDCIENDELINNEIDKRFSKKDYTSQVYALTMGAGKTLLMGLMMLYDFILSYKYPKDKIFAKNALIFAPDKTIIESLKEIKDFDYSKLFPKEYGEVFLNIKYHYLEDSKIEIAIPPSHYNVIVTNSQKIILKTKSEKELRLFNNVNYLEKKRNRK